VYAGRWAPAGLPAWRVGQAVGEWRELAGSAMANTPPTVNPGRDSGGPWAKLDAWNGLALDTRDSALWGLALGGHGDYGGNEVMKFPLEIAAPKWIEMLPSDPGTWPI